MVAFQHYTLRSFLNKAVSLQTSVFSQRLSIFNYYLHQLKIGTRLLKTKVLFLYKEVVENSFSIISIANYRFKNVTFLTMEQPII